MLPHYNGLAARAHAGLSGKPGPDETCWVRLLGLPAAVRLFRAALCTVRRRIETVTALCAFHHLRGVHAGRLRCTGRAPDGLEWQLGIRPGAPSLLSYRSGDVRTVAVAVAAAP